MEDLSNKNNSHLTRKSSQTNPKISADKHLHTKYRQSAYLQLPKISYLIDSKQTHKKSNKSLSYPTLSPTIIKYAIVYDPYSYFLKYFEQSYTK